MNSTRTVLLEGLPSRQANAWDALLDVAPLLGDKWTLIGGQMVLLHQAERQPFKDSTTLRLSHDIDVVVDIRAGRNQAVRLDELLKSHGFVQLPLDVSHRYVRDSDGTLAMDPRANP